MQWKIRNVVIPNQVVVAPMAGVTNTAFRMICRECNAGLVVCEMISDRGIMYKNKKTLGMLFVDESEHPVSIQIFGGTKETLIEAAKYVDQNTEADIIDINMGCPVNKVVKTDAGARWLLDPDKVYEMVSAVTASVDKPVTVKMRTGWDEDHLYAVENAQAAEQGGASAVAMHGRTRAQFYEGKANWNILKKVKENINIPFIGNGDVRTLDDAYKMIHEIGADAVMIGRAAEGNPWILNRIAHYLETGEKLPEQTPVEKIKLAKEHLQRLVDLKGEHVGVREFRGQSTYYLKGIPHAARTKVALTSAETQQEMLDIFDQFTEKLQKRDLI